jgi:hypothetical protein
MKTFINKLIKNDFKVYVTNTENPTYCYFIKNDKIGYCQDSYFGGIDFSSVHKPNKDCGTGFRIYEGVNNPSCNHALDCFIFAPSWYDGNKKEIRKYKNWEDYLKEPTSKILNYIEYKY